MRKAAQWGDVLDSQIELRRSISSGLVGDISSLSNTVDLLVDFGTMEVTILTSGQQSLKHEQGAKLQYKQHDGDHGESYEEAYEHPNA